MSFLENESYGMMVFNYVLENEYDNYFNWCEENNYDKHDLEGNKSHVYAVALLALGEKFQE